MTDEEMIVAYLREHGATICPPAWAEGAERYDPTASLVVLDLGMPRKRREPWR